MAGLSLSPYAKLWFVGTDMGTLFRSTDEGRSWQAIRQSEAAFDSNLALSSPVGFSSDSRTVFFARAGKNPKRSVDSGQTWKAIRVPLKPGESIRYWLGDSSDPTLIFCATSAGLLRSGDKGQNWGRIASISGESQGTYISPHGEVFHATSSGIYLSRNRGRTFKKWFAPDGTGIRGFAGGARSGRQTLAFIDTDGLNACSWGNARTQKECGYVWVGTGKLGDPPRFNRTQKDAGRYIRMAENDPETLYTTGGDWERQEGSKVWVSSNAGKTWQLRLQILNWDTHPYSPWPSDKLEYSAIGLDVGWDDNAYTSFAVNRRNSAQAGGTGYYFLHVTDDYGKKWKAPFTHFSDRGKREKGKAWESTGLEVTSILRLKFNPTHPMLGYAAASDIGGIVTEDGGKSWRICRTPYNTTYDYGFDPRKENSVFAASGSIHDFPLGDNSLEPNSEGGIFRSTDRGKSWTRLTPETGDWNTEFLSVAYDPVHKILYGGTRGRGIGRSTDGGENWEFFNQGLPPGGKIISQIEIDPKDGNAYALLSGDAPTFSNQAATGIYFLDVARDSTVWEPLRGEIKTPAGVMAGFKPWWFPTAFAVDFSRPGRDVLWLADMESKGSWLGSGIWKSIDRGQTWERVLQFTHPTAITLNPNNPDRVYASGLYTLDGSWGKGGAMYSLDGGQSWEKNDGIPLLANLDGATLDPNHPGKIFFLFFGGGMLYGPEPE